MWLGDRHHSSSSLFHASGTTTHGRWEILVERFLEVIILQRSGKVRRCVPVSARPHWARSSCSNASWRQSLSCRSCTWHRSSSRQLSGFYHFLLLLLNNFSLYWRHFPVQMRFLQLFSSFGLNRFDVLTDMWLDQITSLVDFTLTKGSPKLESSTRLGQAWNQDRESSAKVSIEIFFVYYLCLSYHHALISDWFIFNRDQSTDSCARVPGLADLILFRLRRKVSESSLV